MKKRLLITLVFLNFLPTIVYAGPWINTGSGVFDYVFELGMAIAAVYGSFWLLINSYSEWRVRRRNKEKQWHLVTSGEYGGFLAFFIDLFPAIIISIPFLLIGVVIAKLFGGFENPKEIIFTIYITCYIVLVFFRTH
tara:strand:- start:280 stop:690 length:411 start_codon:yes stop_codon:yes gene_type:complete